MCKFRLPGGMQPTLHFTFYCDGDQQHCDLPPYVPQHYDERLHEVHNVSYMLRESIVSNEVWSPSKTRNNLTMTTICVGGICMLCSRSCNGNNIMSIIMVTNNIIMAVGWIWLFAVWIVNWRVLEDSCGLICIGCVSYWSTTVWVRRVSCMNTNGYGRKYNCSDTLE